MNIVAVVVAAVAVLFVPFACVNAFQIIAQAIHASRAGSTEEEHKLVRSLLGLIGLALWIGLAGFWAFAKPSTYDVARYSQMSRQEKKQLRFGVFWSGAGLVCLAVYAIQERSARRRQRSDEAVAQAIENWKAEHKQG